MQYIFILVLTCRLNRQCKGDDSVERRFLRLSLQEASLKGPVGPLQGTSQATQGTSQGTQGTNQATQGTSQGTQGTSQAIPGDQPGHSRGPARPVQGLVGLTGRFCRQLQGFQVPDGVWQWPCLTPEFPKPLRPPSNFY